MFGIILALGMFSGLPTRNKRAEDMSDELYVRQNTGINAEAASAHLTGLSNTLS